MNFLCILLGCALLAHMSFANQIQTCESNLEAAIQRGYNRTEILTDLVATFDIHNEGFVRMETVYLANEKLLTEAQRRLAHISPEEIKRDCAEGGNKLYLDEMIQNKCRCFNEYQLMAQARILINIAKSRPDWWNTK